MNDKALGPNGQPVGSTSDDEVLADLVVACDEALRSGTDWPNASTKLADLDPKVRERLASAKDCLELIDRVRQFRQTETQGLPTGTVAALLQNDAYTAGGTIHRIGRFEIIRELGRGSHGVVFLACDPRLHRQVALKVPRPEAILTPQLRARFLREGKAAARLNHSNILTVHEAGEAGPICYLVQSYCSGASLAAWLREQASPVPCNIAARIVAELAEGVDHAHKQGVLHRDIKPANVMLEPHLGRSEAVELAGAKESDCQFPFVPRLADFGLAKSLDDDPNATATLGTIGTAVYMPPEQAAGQLSLVGPRSDVYSLGALLYELLTGRPPIVGANQLETLRMIGTEEPQLIRRLRSDVPRELEAICLKCLEKSPGRRYATAAALALDLRRFLVGESVLANPQGRLRRTVRRVRRQPLSVLIGLSAIGVLAAALVSWMVASRSDRGDTIASGTKASPADPEVEYLGGIDRVAKGYFDAVAKRGDMTTAVRELDSFLVRHRSRQGIPDYRGFEWHYLWRLCHPDKVAKPFPKLFDLVGHKGEVYFVTFSSDGKQIATAGQDHTGRIWDSQTGKLITTLTGHSADVNWIAFVSDWGFLTASDDHTVRLWKGEAGEPDGVLSTQASKAVTVEGIISAGDNTGHGKGDLQILGGDDDGRLHIWDWRTRRQIKLIPAHSARIEGIARIRSGDQWITASADGTAKEWNSTTWTLIRSHMIGSTGWGSPTICSVACDLEGTLVALGSGKSEQLYQHPQKSASGTELIGAIPVDNLLSGNRWQTIAGPQAGKDCVRFYPDQFLLASACRGALGDEQRNHVIFSDLPTQTFWTPCGTTHPACWCVAFSPDGTRFATAADDGIVRVWDSSTVPMGTRLHGQNQSVGRAAQAVHYSPDGKRLLINSGAFYDLSEGYQFAIWDVSTEGPKLVHGEPTGSKPTNSFAGCYSPDGRFIAIDSSNLGEKQAPARSAIRILDSDALSETRKLEGYVGVAHRILFSSDGNSVIGATGDLEYLHMQLNIWLDAHRTNAVRSWASNRRGDFLATTLSADGKLLATNRDQVEVYEFPSLRMISKLPVDLGKRSADSSSALLRMAACFSPDGDILAMAGEDGIIHLFRPRTGSLLKTLVGEGRAVLSLAFSPDGSRLAAGLDGPSRIDLWHVASGRRLTPLAMPNDLVSVRGLAFAPDGRTLAAAGSGVHPWGSAFLFPLSPVDDSTEKQRP